MNPAASTNPVAPLPAHQPSPLRQLWPSVKPRRGQGLLALLLSCLSILCAIGLIATSGWLISTASLQPPIMVLAVAVVAVRACGVGRGVFRYGERLVSHSAALRGLNTLRVQVVERLAVVAPVGLQGIRRGDALRRVVDDVDATADLSLRVLLPGSTAVIVGGLVVGFVAWLLPTAGIALLVGLLIAGILAPAIGHLLGKRSAAAESSVKGDLAALVSEQLRTCADVVAAGAQQHSISVAVDKDARLRAVEYRSARSVGVATALVTAAQGLTLVAVVLVAVPAVRSGTLDGVNLAVLVLIPLVAFELVVGLPGAALALARSRASAARVVALIDTPDPVPDPKAAVTLPPGPYLLSTRELSVTWPGSASPALVGIDLELSPGRRVALVGPSGSGKSTLAAALVRFAPITGFAALCGVPLSELSGDDVRRVVGLCEQDAHIFDNTIAENIRLAHPGANDWEIEAALRDVKLWDWVSSLPKGMRTEVGEHGSQLSGGQRQRISLARVLLAGFPIVIFDEPTEHLDEATAASLTADILDATADRGVLLITHSLRGLGEVDEIIVLEHGEVARRGTPRELAVLTS